MNATLSVKPFFKAGWLRALIYLVVLFILIGTAVVAFILGLHKGGLDASGIQELMKGNNAAFIVLMIFGVTLLITYIFRRWIDHKSFISLGLDIKAHGLEAIGGAALAFFIMGSSCLIIQATGNLKWMDILFDPQSLFLAFGAILLSAFYEELIFRGYLLSNLLDSFPKWLALVLSSVLFMCFHWNSIGFFPMLNSLLMGGISGLIYLYTRNLWFPVCFHAVWKFMAGPVLGFSNESNAQSLLQISIQGNENITGGVVGIQGSLILTALSLLCAVALYFILQKKLNPGSLPVLNRI